MVCFSLTGFFTALFEPLLNRKRISLLELGFSLITLLGIVLIFHFEMRFRYGILLGVVSSALAALFTVANKKVGTITAPSTVLLYELVGGFLFITILLPVYLYFYPQDYLIPGTTDLVYLFLFAFFCTICMCVLQIQALKSISAFTMNLSYNLEPVYSIAGIPNKKSVHSGRRERIDCIYRDGSGLFGKFAFDRIVVLFL